MAPARQESAFATKRGGMRFFDVVAAARRISTRGIAGRGAALAALVLVERVLTSTTAWAILGGPRLEKLVFAFALGLLFSARTVAQQAIKARTEADLFERVVSRLIDGDVLRTNVLPDEDARAELTQAVYQAGQGVSIELPLLAGDAAAATLLAILIVLRSPARLAALAVGMTLIAAVALLAMRRSMERALTDAWLARRAAHDTFVDAVEGRLDVVASGRRVAFRSQMSARARAWAAAGSRVAFEALVANRLPLLTVGAMAVGLAVALAATRPAAFGVTTEEVALLAGITPAFFGVVQRLFALGRVERWITLVAGVLAEPSVHRGTGAPPPLPTVIAFEGVSFRYEGSSRNALDDVTVSWRPGRVLALTGANGSGKSTCLRLLLALAPPQSGRVTAGGTSLHEIEGDAWRAKIAFLSQRPYMPPRSDVRAAVRFLAPEASDESIGRALERVALLGKLRDLGDDPLGVRIDVLSVGERQRLGLARVLCQRPALALLDEPDANLDRAGIELVAAVVRELAGEAMVAVAAHTRELLAVADQVVVLDRGRVVREEGHVRLAGS